ncbi:hypothetical protein [Antribacter gilvus]|uniref:hypothetical protein n=1 Tax=Antribacter gilvus TaxID=2304675 RepID=UPI000F794B3D|nr:hypothetical protein [Antribacter gilvus]
MNTKTTTAGEHDGATVRLSPDDALFGLELHRGQDGWTATTTGPHLPPVELTGVTYQPETEPEPRGARA